MLRTNCSKMLHYCYDNVCMFIVTCFIAVRFKENLVSALCRWLANSAEIRRSYVIDCTYKL
jgi:hypothetical protein